jgi:hypothetical protein
MASTIESDFGSSGQPLTITLNNLAASNVAGGTYTGRQSTAVDNTTNLFLDALVSVQVKTQSSVVAPSFVLIYAYGTADGGLTWSDTVTGADGSVSLISPPNAPLLCTLATPAVSTVYDSGPLSVASAFGGVLPQKWGVVVINSTGSNLDTTTGGAAVYQGVYAQRT